MSFALTAKQTAETQWNFFGNQTRDVHNSTLHAGHKEDENGWFQRVGQFWLEGTDTPNRNGLDNIAWSAAFISWVVKTSGAGDRFHYSAQHSVYISRAIKDRATARAAAGYWAFRLNETKPQVGDLVCWSRQPGIDFDHQAAGNYLGHCDLVTDVQPGFITIIGGNVGDSVTQRPCDLDAQGFLKPLTLSGETLFALMQNRIP